MVCSACGNPVAGPGAFCSRCGAQVPVPAPAPGAYPSSGPGAYPGPYQAAPYGVAMPPVYTSRVSRHLQTLGILWFVYGAYRAVTAAFGALFLAGIAPRLGFGPWGIPGENWGFVQGHLLGALMVLSFTYLGITTLLAFVTGYGLTTRRPWARTLAIVTGILALIRIPVGTGLGIYTLWVLAPGASGAEYDAIAIPD